MSIKFFSKLSLVAITAGVALSGMASSASAGGFLADTFIRPLSPQAADLADGVHREMGAPLNAVPGQIVRQLPGGQFFGDHCATAVGVFGPGPVLPIGTPCNGRGYPGSVVR